MKLKILACGHLHGHLPHPRLCAFESTPYHLWTILYPASLVVIHWLMLKLPGFVGCNFLGLCHFVGDII